MVGVTRKHYVSALVVLMLLVPVGFFARAALNYPLVKRTATKEFMLNQALFSRAAVAVQQKRILDIHLGEDGHLRVTCENGACLDPGDDVRFLVSLGFPRIFSSGQDVYFVRDEGLDYNMGVARLANQPLVLQGRGFEFVPLMAEWYIYRSSH